MENTVKRLLIAGIASVSLAGLFLDAQQPAPAQPSAVPPPPAAGAWTTYRGNAQRQAWVQADEFISVDSMQKPGMTLEWTVKVGNNAKEFLTGAVGANTNGNAGTQRTWPEGLDPAPGQISGSGNNLYGFSIDTGGIVWTRHFNTPPPAAGTAQCPGGMTAGLTRATTLDQVVIGARASRDAGVARPRSAVVSNPGEGIPDSFLAAAGRGGGRAAGGSGGVAPPRMNVYLGRGGGTQYEYLVSSDGMLHKITQVQGKEAMTAVRFLPPDANATDLLLVNGVIYTSTINSCGGVPNGVWAIDLGNGNVVTSWKSGASPAGPVAMDTKGNVYVSIGGGSASAGGYSEAIVKLDPKTLAVKDWFTMPGASFSSTPVVFTHGNRELLSSATMDGRVFLLDTASLGGADHKTALAISGATTTAQTFSPTALATWQDSSETRWLLVPAVGAKSGIVAFKVTGDAKPALQQTWNSPDFAAPSAPIVVNGVVFALSNGSASSRAVLHAMDGLTGRELWNSGKQIASFARNTPLWSINGQVYVTASDNTVYAFGFADGRHL